MIIKEVNIQFETPYWDRKLNKEVTKKLGELKGLLEVLLRNKMLSDPKNEDLSDKVKIKIIESDFF